jgi:hypothetical protein
MKSVQGRIAWLTLAALSGCAGRQATASSDTTQAALGAVSLKGSGDPRCDATNSNREVSEYDTSGDEIPDVRKVFQRAGGASSQRLVMICREVDINRDGKKDVVRIYDNDGRPLREDSDRNFDGKIDQVSVYQNGELVLQESDDNFDGRIESKVYFSNGQPVRAERDIAGRSTTLQWHPDRWEYFENGKMVRIGTDLDGDTRVDRWDRDAAWKRAQDVAQAQAVAGD